MAGSFPEFTAQAMKTFAQQSNQGKTSEEKNLETRMLVVDDDPTVCELVQEVLGLAGIESLSLTSSKKAATLSLAKTLRGFRIRDLQPIFFANSPLY
jgi:PleD family two-component response regulator